MGTGPAETATVDVAGHRVGLTVEGDGPPLVLLHGIGRDRSDWCTVQPALTDRFTTYAIDLEGFGRSDGWGAVSLASIAAVARRALDAVGERRPLRLVGNSLGGAVAMRIAADDPAAVAGLVLISPAGFGPDAAVGLRLLTVPVLGPLLLRLDATPPALALRARLLRRDELTQRLSDAAARRLRDPAMRRQYLQVIHDLGSWHGIGEEWRRAVLDALAASGIPTLVLWGDRDTVLPYAHLAAVQAAVPHAEVLPLPGLGHMPQLEDPERIAALVADFLGGQTPSVTATERSESSAQP